MKLPGPTVSPDWLAAHLDHPRLAVLDASWYLPVEGRDPRTEHLEARIPGARFFDLEAVVDHDSPLPHMAPPAEVLESALVELGIGASTSVVVYDGHGVFSAPRTWWLLRAFGKTEVAVLDGGLPRWRALGHRVEGGAPPAVVPVASDDRFVPRPKAALRADRQDLLTNLATGEAQVVDARSTARFRGDAPEPRPGLRRGHIPGARNLPWTALLGADEAGTLALLSASELRSLFAAAAVRLDAPIVTTCGSGVSAAVVSLALAVLGASSAVYDGSWAEWGADSNLPAELGPPLARGGRQV